MVVGNTIQIYESWRMIKKVEISLKDNLFTMVRTGSIRPYGYMGLLPGFEKNQLILVSGSKGLIPVSPELDYHDPLILINTPTAFG